MSLLTRALCVVAVLCVGCGADTPVRPTTPPPPACQSQNTATVYFQNRSSPSRTYDIIWDGSRLTTISPGQDSQTYTVVANIPHTLRFQYTNTTLLACSQSSPTLTTCSSNYYYCTF